MKLFSKSGMFKDSLLNIIGSLILTIAVQALAYPFLAQNLTIKEYGIILTVMGIINTVGVSLGNSLNNTRILTQSNYDKKALTGDYNVIFIFIILLGMFITGLLSFAVLNKFDTTIIGCKVITVLIIFRSYYSVGYRLIINYKKMLFSNLWGAVGYLIGIIFTIYTGVWVFTFIFGELLACIYVYITSHVVNEELTITPLIKSSLKKYSYIMSASFISNSMIYLDRFFIYPVLGADQVSLYTVASFLGKTAGILLNPIAGVLLTYYVRDKSLTVKQFSIRTGIFTLFSLLIFILIMCIGIPITGLFYPTIIKSAVPYFYVANLASVLLILGNTIQPTLLTYCNTKWHLIIQISYFLIYTVLGYIGLIENGLIGFCYAVLISNSFRIISMLMVIFGTLYKRNNAPEFSKTL